MASISKLSTTILKLTAIAAVSFAFSNTALAHKYKHHCKSCDAAPMETYKDTGMLEPIWTPHWYAGANIGVSNTHDKRTISGVGSVKNTGPGWSVDGGYQFTPTWGAEMGYTGYNISYDDSHSVNIAQTQHYSVDAALTGQYPLVRKLNALGKAGVAYNYARKDTPFGPTADSGSVSAYGGLGFEYNLNQHFDVIAQWARSWGNNYTGSTDLYSIGLKVALI
ncbi:MAG: outer membrane beta-barrel protein [Gammaproteobacteria bacterium]